MNDINRFIGIVKWFGQFFSKATYS